MGFGIQRMTRAITEGIYNRGVGHDIIAQNKVIYGRIALEISEDICHVIINNMCNFHENPMNGYAPKIKQNILQSICNFLLGSRTD